MHTAVKGSRLSFQQHRLWTLQKENQAYYTYGAIRLEGHLDLERFFQALQQLVDRYEILRTLFYLSPGMAVPVQVVAEQTLYFCPLVECQDVHQVNWQEFIAEQLNMTERTVLGLERGPLFRASLLRLDTSQHILLLLLPSLCADAPTLLYLAHELCQLMYSKQDHDDDDDDVLQYADVAAWQYGLLQEEEADEYKAYWRQVDLSPLERVVLPLTSQRWLSDPYGFTSQYYELPLPSALAAQISQLAEQNDTTISAIVLASWCVLLARLCNGPDILLGLAYAGRAYEELQSAFGLYTHFVPFGFSLSSELSMLDLVQQVTLRMQESAKYQEYFTWDLLEPSSGTSLSLPFGFEELDATDSVLSTSPLSLFPLTLSSDIEPFALRLLVLLQSEGGIQLALHADARYLSVADCQRIADSLLTLLQSVVAHPDQRAVCLNLFAERERQVVQAALVPSPQSRVQPADAYGSLWQAILQQRDCAPDQVALICGQEYVTYAHLVQRACQLAHLLRDAGVQPGSVVVLGLERSVDEVLALLAVLQAGAVYAPLDMEHPAQRLRWQVEDLQSGWIITQQKWQARWQELAPQAQVICLDADVTRQHLALQSAEPLLSAVDDKDALAYIIYTSGSTGRPKGVMVRRWSVTCYTQALCAALRVQVGWHCATVSTLTADLGNTAIFCSLASGGCLHLLPYEIVTSGWRMAEYMRQHPLDLLKIVPSHMQALLESSHGEAVWPQRALVLGGEMFSWPLLEQLQQSGARCEVFNHYGPTEATVGAVIYPVGQLGTEHVQRLLLEEQALGTGSVPLGTPLPHMQCYVLDEEGAQVPAGVVGELYLGGDGLAIGYWRQDELTRERFIAYPLEPRGEQIRLYRTGDLVRLTANGVLEFLGRKDNQIKIRGYRIELEEISRQLALHPAVRECVVIVSENQGVQRLVAYVALRQAETLSAEALREYLQALLPEPMVPAAFVFLRQLPLTSNGKIDHAALPVPAQDDELPQALTVAPRTPIEEVIIAIWAEVLKVKHIGAQDNFFHLGGHSLLATQIISRLRSAFAIELSILSLFESPTVEGLAALVERTLRGQQMPEVPPLEVVERSQPLPLSFAQQRLWFLDQLEPNGTAYNKPLALRLKGNLRLDALTYGLSELVRRHESLRTTFPMVDNQPVQVIAVAAPVHLPLIDLGLLQEEAQEEIALSLARAEAASPFDLARGPLLRMALLRLNSREHVLLLTMHHIMSDGWSNGIVLRELTALYTAFVAQQPSPLPELPFQYVDFALWQQRWLQGEALQSQLSYWQKQLEDLEPLNLPLDHPRPAVQTSQGAEESYLLPAALLQQLKELGQRENATLFMLLLASFQTLLYRYTGQEDIAVGTPIANRSRVEIENLIGFFVNTLVMRTALSPAISFRELIGRVRQVAVDAYMHQDLPFEKLVEVIHPERDLSRSPLFQVLFVLQNAPMPKKEFGDVKLSLLESENPTAIFDLTMTLTEEAHGLTCVARYSTDLFERVTMQRLFRHWHTLLEAIVSAPDLPLAQLSMLPADEAAQIKIWNTQQIAYPDDLCVHQLFAAQAQHTPDAIALIAEQTHISYQELDERANRLAHFLRLHGVGHDRLVAICMQRSVEMIVGVLGVLKAGAAYVPLDPTYPQERLALMLQDSQAHVLLTQEALRAQLPAEYGEVICLDTWWPLLPEKSTAVEGIDASPDDLAYVIYTSGSTGQPKGVAMVHGALTNLITWQLRQGLASPSERTLQFTSLSFDASFQEMFFTWCSGGTLVLISEMLRRDFMALAQFMYEAAVERIFLPFVALQQLVQAFDAQPQLNACVKEMITAGEQLQITPPLLNFFTRHPLCLLHNYYGPSESHVVTAFTLPSGSPADWPTLPPIGRPIANTTAYILNQDMQLAPLGMPGELYLGGVCLARGYLHAPVITAEKFVPDPFGVEPGGRLYRTGDLARYRANGDIEFLGRLDHQVKVRGYRIELGEVENVLAQHQLVQECVVALNVEDDQDKRLVAYVVPRESYATGQSSAAMMHVLYKYMQTKLPEYMVPVSFVLLEALPLTPTGKINRRVLPSPTSIRRGDLSLFVAPRNPLEELVAQIWCEILRLPHVSVHDNFFDLGGHSLLATRLIARMRKLLQIELPLRALFESPTVAQLTEQVKLLLGGEQAGSQAATLMPVSREQELPLSFSQQRLWFLHQLEPEGSFYNTPMAVRVTGPLQVAALALSFQELVRRHESLRTTFVAPLGVPVQVVHATRAQPLPVIDLCSVPYADRDALAMQIALQAARRPFVLQHGPLLRTFLIRLAEQEHILLLVMHHIVFDGWSLGILRSEIIGRYEALVHQQPFALPDLPVQYADFAVWQRRYLEGAVLESQLAYWREHLAGAPAFLDLPTDHPRLSPRNQHKAVQTVQIDRSLTDSLLALSQRADATLFMTLLTALEILLFQWTGQEDIVLGTVIANRIHGETDSLIGCFMNFLALRSFPQAQKTARDLLSEVKALTLEAYAHQDCPFEKLVETLQPDRSHYHNPFYNVAFLLQNFPGAAPISSTLQFAPVPLDNQAALLDLRFVARELPEGILLGCEYDGELFESETIQAVLEAYCQILASFVFAPDTALSAFTLPQVLQSRAEAARLREQKQTLAIAATFTAEPLEDALSYWMQEMHWPSELVFAPYNQVFQQLLDPVSPLALNRRGMNILLVRLEDWYDFEHVQDVSPEATFTGLMYELVRALTVARRHSSVPFLLCICPASPGVAEKQLLQTLFTQLENQLAQALQELSGVYLVDSRELQEIYPVAQFYDQYSDKIGHIPYTPLFFSALSSMITRRMYALRTTPYKVIVVDCDQTLWQGVCAEDGPEGIVLDPARTYLQKFLLAQQAAGMLLCLCSKNAEQDVFAVFAAHPEMPLSLEHFVSWRINWQDKPQNLRSLAEELQLSLESFIFIDDSMLECAAVQARCPEVLTLPLPEDIQQLPHMLRHFWAFDHLRVTHEDKQRTDLYRQQAQRQAFLSSAPTLEAFLEGLDLQVNIRPLEEEHVARAAQLTQRTNQFNCATVRYSESDLLQYHQRDYAHCFTVAVRDRFGDYGIVGVILCRLMADAVEVETFLLSCRALGRGVEHQMLAAMGALACEQNCEFVRIQFAPTAKNKPALDFLHSLAADFSVTADGKEVCMLPARSAAALQYLPASVEASLLEELSADSSTYPAKSSSIQADSAHLLHIATQLSVPEQVLHAVSAQRRHYADHAALTFSPPRSGVEEQLVEIWEEILHLKGIGIHDNFFSVGGHSLLATQLLSRVSQVFRIELPLRDLFDWPTIAELAARLEMALSTDQQLHIPPLVPVSRDKTLPLSYAQQRLWFLDQLEGGSPFYNIFTAVRLTGKLDEEAFAQSLRMIVLRHESLRTNFVTEAGQARQLIRSEGLFELQKEDARFLSADAREARIQHLLLMAAQQPFDLAHDSLLRAALIRCSDDEHIFLLTLHHIVSDGWSSEVFFRELTTMYTALVEHTQPRLPALPIQYADFAVWQRQWLQGQALQRQVQYWQEQLADATVLSLPTDRPRPAVQTFNGARVSSMVPQTLLEDLKMLAQREGVTLFMVLLAAFQVLLYRYSGQDDILVGTPIANRRTREIEDLIGFFVNTLVLRTDLSGNPTFQTLLARVREVALGAYAHQDLPFEKLIDALQIPRDLSLPPLFQVMFILQNTPSSGHVLPDVVLSPLDNEGKTARFDLTLSVKPDEQGLLCVAEYNTDLFHGATIEYMLTCWLTLLQAVVQDPARHIATIPLLTQDAWAQFTATWQEALAGSVSELCLHQLVEQQAASRPDALAVVMEDASLSYTALNRRANQLASYLRRQGMGPGTLVGLCMERSLEALIAILGILKAGCAYVPVDPFYPQERLAYILQDAQPGLVLTQARFTSLFSFQQTPVQALDDAFVRALEQEHSENPALPVDAKDLAYVIYTSGSTGAPKGVLIQHQGVINLMDALQTQLAINADSHVLQFVPLYFDPSIADIFMAFGGGATLYLAPQTVMDADESFLHFLRSRAITVGRIPPMVLESFSFVDLPALQTIIVGGDTWSATSLRRWSEGRRFVNEYGPTEASICTTQAECFQDDSLPSIGKPLKNVQVYLLDENFLPVPPLVPGELFIAGPGLARGYLNRADLTAEKFIPHPFSPEPGSRLYRTGDVARYRADGNLEFLHRVDQQVKIRGFRIELGEIEATLASHPAVRANVVLARTDSSAHKRLVAYVVPVQGVTIQGEELRKYVEERLPAYMVPAAWVMLDALPLTSHGKVDVRALPSGEELSFHHETFVAPRTWVEQLLVAAWQQVLGVARVGIHDNFFALGGDSILSIQVIARARQAGLQFTTKQLFQYQTIAQLSKVVVYEPAQQAEQGPVTGPFPLLPIQHWFLQQDLPEIHHWNQALFFAVDPLVKLDHLALAVRQTLSYHDALHVRFKHSAQGWQAARDVNDVLVPLTHIDLTNVALATQREIIEKQAANFQRSLHIEEGPLARVVLFRGVGQEQSSRLLIVIHHLVVDGISWRILLADIQMAYQQARKGITISFPDKTTSFRAWAQRLISYAQSQEVQAELPYWLTALQEPPTSLAYDHVRGENTVASMRSIRAALSAEETRTLLQEVPAAYHTQINDVLLTALVLAFQRCQHLSRLLVDLEGHGREELFADIDLSRTVGWFTMYYPLLLAVDPLASVEDALWAVKEQLQQVPHHGLGYGLLRYLSQDAQVQAQLAQLPASALSFNYLGQFGQVLGEDSFLKVAQESAGLPHSSLALRSHILEINASVNRDQLEVVWAYSENLHRAETIQGLAEAFCAALREIIAYSHNASGHSLTPGDFPLVRLTQSQLNQVIESILQRQGLSNAERGVTSIQDIYPLSSMQRGMLFHSLLDPHADMYFEQVNFTLHNRFDHAAFIRSWQRLVERHDILRTCFYLGELAQPVQVVCREVLLPVEQLDWRDYPASEQESRLDEYIHADRLRGFAFDRPLLTRLALLQLADDHCHLIWSFHHALLDGWSIPVLIKDLLMLYEQEIQGRSDLLRHPAQYREYIAWQQQQDFSQEEPFWRSMLQHFASPTPLLKDLEVQPEAPSTEDYAEVALLLTPEETAALQALGQQYQVTLSTLVQGAWALLLSRYSGEEAVLFGAVVAGRPAELADVASMAGMFINTLPVPVMVAEEEKTYRWLQQLQEQIFELRQHEYTALTDIQGWSAIPRGTPLFDSVVVFENYPVDSSVVNDEHLALRIDGTRTLERTNYALTFVAVPGARLLLRLGYATQRFAARSVERMLEHLRTILRNFARDSKSRLYQISLFEPQAEALLQPQADASASMAAPLCLHQLFEAVAEQNADALALSYEGAQVTYACLNRRANQLAHALLRMGVKPGHLVALRVERSLEMVVAILGILQVGAAYVPLDVVYPAERVEFILQDAQVELVVTQRSLAVSLTSQHINVLFLDDIWSFSAAEPVSSPLPVVSPEYPAYVIYTSGSTGLPKGVLVTHAQATRLFLATQHWFHFGRYDTWTLFHSYAFDFSVWELWGALLYGGRLVLASHTVSRSPELFYALLREEGVTVLNQTPTAFQQLLQFVTQAAPIRQELALRLIIFGGEALELSSLLPWFARYGDTSPQLVNMYGITETTVHVTYRPISQADCVQKRGSVIGQPIPDLRLYVLDRYLRPVPVGVPGEIYVGGAGVSSGYLYRPALTAERFIPSPFAQIPGERLYKTGDAACYLENGELVYLGRLDQQVKIRGFRIELGEIEAVLRQQDHVQDAVVLAQGDAPDMRLIAYLVTSVSSWRAQDIRLALQRVLPEYMLPASFVRLDALPLTINGKVDRRALLLLQAEEAATDTSEPLSLLTPLEELLASCWREVLGVKHVGRFDSFFALGGHSLLATQLIARLRRVLQLDVPVRLLFEEPVLASLAARLDQLLRGSAGQVAPPLQKQAHTGMIPLSFAQQRLWLALHLEASDTTSYNIPTVLRVHGALELSLWQNAVQALVQRHEGLRTTFHSRTGEPYQQIHQHMDIPLRLFDLRSLPDDQQETWARHLTAQLIEEPYDVQIGPLWRICWLRLAEQEHWLVMTMHHLISDAWSHRILVRELSQIYESQRRQEDLILPDLPIQYADYALWQRQWFQGPLLQSQLDYWQKRLQGAQALLLPTDHERRAVMSLEGAGLHWSLGATLSEQIRQISQQEGATVFMSLLAGFQILLARLSGQRDVVVGTDIANRGYEEMEGVIGFFVNLVAVRTEIKRHASYRQVLQLVREEMLETYSHQETPFELVVERLRLKREGNRTPLIRILFVQQNVPQQGSGGIGNVEMEIVESQTSRTKFELAVFVVDGQEGELHLGVNYSTEIFARERIENVCRSYEALLSQAIAHPDESVDTLDLLSSRERQQQLLKEEALQRVNRSELMISKGEEIDLSNFGFSIDNN